MTNVQFSGVPFSDVLRSTLEKNVHFSETLYHYAIRHVRTWKKNYNKRNKIEKQCKQLGKQRNKKTATNWVWKSFRFNFIYIIVSNQMRCFSYPEKTADIPRRQHWFPREITSEERAQKFHTDDASLPRSDWLEICFNQPHLGNDTSSVWNFCTRFSESFHGETSGDDANVGIFLRLWSPPILPFAEADRLLSKEHGSANKRDGFVTILVVGHSIQAISWFRKAASFPEFTLFPIMRKRFSEMCFVIAWLLKWNGYETRETSS